MVSSQQVVGSHANLSSPHSLSGPQAAAPLPPPSPPPAAESQTSPFSCNICHKTYTRVDHLARHVRAHTQEKPFACPVCGKSFARADLLKRHSANHDESADGRKRRRLNQPQSRVAQACVACAVSKLRCSGDEPCKRCGQKNLECRYNKPRTSIIQDEAVGQDPLDESADSTPQEEWPMPSIPAHAIVVGPQFSRNDHRHITQQHHQQDVQSLNPDRSRTRADGNHASQPLTPLAMARNQGQMQVQTQMPNQLPTPSSTGQPIEVSAFSESMQDVAPGMDYYDSSFTDFLKDVMMSDQMNNEQDQNPLGLSKNFTPFDLLDFAADESLNFFGDNYNTLMPPDVVDSHADLSRTDNHIQPHSTSGQATPSGSGGIRLGAQAFKDSIWLYAPSSNHRVYGDQNNMFMPLENLVTKTRCRTTPPCGSLNAAVRDRVLATVLAESPNAIVPDVVSSFPSAELLTNLIHMFFLRHELLDDSFIHGPTYDPNNQSPVCLMGIIAAGAAMSELPQIRKLGYAFQESARRSVTEMIERDNRTIRHLRPLQTYALQLDVGLWSGDRRRMEICESHALIMVTMIRRGGFFRQSLSKCPLPTQNDSPQVVESKWRQWIEKESFKRLTFHLLIRDAQTSIALINPPLVSPSEVLVELPASSDLWRAKTPQEWKDLILMKHTTSRGPIPTLRAATDDFSLVTDYLDMIDVPLTNLLVLCSLWSLSWQYRELIRLHVSSPGGNSSLITKSLYQEIVQSLQRFRLYSSDWNSGIQPLAIILHERVLLNLHASLEDVQLFAGKAGEEEARRVYPVLVAWAQSRESRQAVWYAGQIFKAAKEYTTQTLQEFSAVALYHASLVFWAYSIMSSCAASMSHLSPQDNQQIVLIDGDDNPNIQRFIILGKGCAALNASMNASSGEARIVPIHDAKAVTTTVIDLLKRNNGGKDVELSPLVSNLSKLMRSLGNAAKGIKISQSTTQSVSST